MKGDAFPKARKCLLDGSGFRLGADRSAGPGADLVLSIQPQQTTTKVPTAAPAKG